MKRAQDGYNDNTPGVLRVIIAGGATGGHLFPGIAIAESLRQQVPDCDLLFVSTGTDLEDRVLPETGFEFEKIPSEGIKGRGITGRIRAIRKLLAGLWTSARLIRRFKPDIIIGMGGYSSAPTVISGWFMGVKIALHEQNTLPGISNRLLARFADRVFVSLAPSGDRFPPRKVVFTGNPVRREILQVRVKDRSVIERANGHFTIFVIGGSQGASSLNRSVAEALEHLPDKKAFFFIHQTGQPDEEAVRQAYARQQVPSRVAAFFSNMAEMYARADLLLCRAGATTVAEILCLGKPALLVPFPYAADDHQTCNARALVAAEGAEMIPEEALTGKELAEKFVYYAARPDLLKEMSQRVRALGRPRAGQRVVEECLALVAEPRKWRSLIYACI